MKRDPIATIWLAGIALAIVLYVVDPARALDAFGQFGREAARALDLAYYHLSIAALDAVRAAALGAYVVFVALCLVSINRGGRGRTALLAVSAAFALLVGVDSAPGDRRWGLALLLAGVGAVVMTRRLRSSVPALR